MVDAIDHLIVSKCAGLKPKFDVMLKCRYILKTEFLSVYICVSLCIYVSGCVYMWTQRIDAVSSSVMHHVNLVNCILL